MTKEELKLKIQEVIFNKNVNKKTIIVVAILLIGIFTTVYLVGRQQLFRSRASVDITKAFEVKDDKDNVLYCTPTAAGASCPTQAGKVYIRLKDMEPLLDN